MVSRADFSPAVIFKMVATMCERGSSTATNAMKTEVHLEPVVDSEEDTVQELLAAAARVKTMPARPAIERSSISPGVVVVDNSQSIFQLIGPKGKVFVPRRVLLDSGAQPLMLEASAVAGLELTKDTLEECPWTISTSMGGNEARYRHYEGRVVPQTQPGGCGGCRLHEDEGHCHGRPSHTMSW
jgi:hypothetical protein